MSESSEQENRSPEDTPEYLKFVALLAVIVVGLLALAIVSPRLIGQGVPAVLGLGGAPDSSSIRAGDEEPGAEAAPETVTQPENVVGPEQAYPAAGQGGLGADAEGLRHEVQAGETLYQVAETYGVSVQELAAANNLVNPLQLQPGTVLLIPQPR